MAGNRQVLSPTLKLPAASVSPQASGPACGHELLSLLWGALLSARHEEGRATQGQQHQHQRRAASHSHSGSVFGVFNLLTRASEPNCGQQLSASSARDVTALGIASDTSQELLVPIERSLSNNREQAHPANGCLLGVVKRTAYPGSHLLRR